MRKFTKWFGIMTAAAMMTGVLSGCGSSDSGSSSSSDGLTEVSMVSPTALASMDLCWVYAADAMGYFEDEGIKLNMIECTDGSDPKMLASGQAQFGGFSPSVGLTAVEAGADNFKAVSNTVSCNMFGIAYNKEGGVSDWSDIDGKTIASINDSFASIYNPILEAAGVDADSVSYMTYGSAEYEALDSNQAPVMGTWLSEYYMCLGMGYDWGYLSGDDVLPQIANSLWVNNDFAEENPDLVKGFVRATAKACYLCYVNPEAVADMVLNRYPSIEITWDGAVGAIKGNVASMFGIDEADQKTRIDNHEIGIYDMDIVKQTITNLFNGGALTKELDAETYYTNDYVDTTWDYAEVEKDAEAYSCTSKVYTEANAG